MVADGIGMVADGVWIVVDGFAQCERNEVVGVGFERGGNGRGNGLEHAVEIEVGEAGFAEGGEADAVGGLADLGIVRDLRGVYQAGGTH